MRYADEVEKESFVLIWLNTLCKRGWQKQRKSNGENFFLVQIPATMTMTHQPATMKARISRMYTVSGAADAGTYFKLSV